MSPTPGSPEPPASPGTPEDRPRRRPTPLLLEALLGSTVDSADEYQARRCEARPTLPSTEVPVRRTFIDFGCSEHIACQQVSTAPACMGLSIGTLLGERRVEDDGSPSTCMSSLSDRGSEASWPVQGPSAAGFQAGLPEVLYQMSPTSAKAAGYWTRCPSAGSSQSFPTKPSGSIQTQDDAEACAEAEVESTASTSGDDDDYDYRNACPEYSPDAKLPSVGSALHGEGGCKRCCFFPKGRCTNGEDCQFCHFAHEKRKTKHKKKSKKHRKSKRKGACHTSSGTPLEPGYLGPFREEVEEFPAEFLQGQEQHFFVPAIIPSQVLVDASFPHEMAVAIVPVPFVYDL